MKTLKIRDEVHKMLKKYCNEKGYKINILVENLIIKFLEKEVYNDDNK